MPRAPFTIAAAVVAGAVLVTIHLALRPDPFASDAAAVVAAGSLVFALITAVGLLLSRGRWALRLGIAVAVWQMGLGLAVDLGALSIGAIAASAVALAGLSGPWLRGWLRERPAAMGPGAGPVLVLLTALALVPGAGIASPSGLGWQHGALGAVAVVGVWGYSRAAEWGLWLLRLLLPVAAVAAALASPAAGGAYLIAHAVVVEALAWRADALRAVRPLLDRLYGPRAFRPVDRRTGREP